MSTSNGKMRRVVRHKRLRSKISGTAERPRLAVYRSISHIYAQLIDDVKGSTIAAASSLENGLNDKEKDAGKISISKVVGEFIGKRAASAREDGLCIRNRLFQPFPPLRQCLRFSRHSWPGADDRHRFETGPARTECFCGDG